MLDSNVLLRFTSSESDGSTAGDNARLYKLGVEQQSTNEQVPRSQLHCTPTP